MAFLIPTLVLIYISAFLEVSVVGTCDDINDMKNTNLTGKDYLYGCHPGFYCDWSGSGWYAFGTCKLCPLGHSCSGGQGDWSDSNPAQRVPCGPGRYSSSIGNHFCTYCEIGKFQESKKSTECKSCPEDPEGNRREYSYTGSEEESQCSDKCPYEKSSSDNLCDKPCEASKEKYFDGSECKTCGVGTYLRNDFPSMPLQSMLESTTITQSDACTDACPPGKYTDGTVCTDCEEGKYSTFSGSTQCFDCPTGRYRSQKGSKGVYECDFCKKGKYNTNKGSDSLDNCKECDKGTFSDEGATKCTVCPTGRSTSVTGKQFISNATMTCEECRKGKYDAGVGEGCKVCPVGRYTGAGGKTSCSYCELGSYSDENSSACVDCQRGRFLSFPDNKCLDCELGTYNPREGQTKCIKCPPGRYADNAAVTDDKDAGDGDGATSDKVCQLCDKGKYSSTEGQYHSKACKECPMGKYNSKSGSSVCSDCQPGRYGESSGQDSQEGCSECFENQYSLAGASECMDCPDGYSTRGAKGSSACVPPPRVLSSYEKTMNNFKNGLAYVVTILVSGLFAVVAGLIYTLRARDARLVPLTLVQTVTKMMFSAVSIVSEAFLLAMFFAKGGAGTTYGIIVLIFRLLHFVPTGIILVFAFNKFKYYEFSPSIENLKSYREKFAKDHFITAIYPYAVVTLFACLDCTMIVFLPWYFTDFGLASIGFPNMFALRMTNFYKITQDLVRFTCNIAYITSEVSAEDASVSAFFGLNIAISLTGIILSSMIAVMKAGVLYEIEKAGGTEVGSGAGKPSGGGSGEDVPSVENPLHRQRRSQDASISIREWLMLTIPEPDAPSIHAVDSAFKRDGILTLGDLMDCIRGQVIEMSEVKTYTREGKLGKMDTLAVMRAIERAMKANQSTARRLSGMFGGSGEGGGEPSFSAPQHGSGGVLNRAQVRKSMMVSRGGDDISPGSPAMKELQDQYESMAKAQIKAQERALQVQTEAIVGALNMLNASAPTTPQTPNNNNSPYNPWPGRY